MTALKEYQRLESGGLWRAEADSQRRDVVVSFGDATLVIADGAGRPLTHWSLAAVARLNPGTRPALFAPDADTDETLEIEDTYMTEAIEKVRKSIARGRPRQGKLRGAGTLAIVVGLVALGAMWLPGALREQALRVVPDSKRLQIGAVVLSNLQEMTGPVCRGPAGQQALRRFQTRLLGSGSDGQIVLMPLGQETAVPLPGGIIALDRALVERLDDPAIAAGFVLAADRSRRLRDPLLPVLQDAGFVETLRLLATGDLSPEVLRGYAVDLIGDQAPILPEGDLIPVFAAAKVPSSPFGQYRQARGQPVMDLIVADPMKDDDPPVVISDGDWVAMQGMCNR